VRPLTREQFIYQPALEQTRRAGVARYPKRRGPLGHECTGLHQDAVGVDLTIRRTGPDSEVRQAPRRLRDRRRRRVQPDPRAPEPRVRGALLQGPLGRHRHEGHQALARGRPAAVPLQPGPPRSTGSGSIATRPARRWTAPPRWATTAGSSRSSRGGARRRSGHTAGGAGAAGRSGHRTQHVQVLRAVIYNHHVRFADRWRIGCSWQATPRMRPSGSLGSAGATIARLRIAVGPLGSASTNQTRRGYLHAVTCDQHVIA